MWKIHDALSASKSKHRRWIKGRLAQNAATRADVWSADSASEGFRPFLVDIPRPVGGAEEYRPKMVDILRPAKRDPGQPRKRYLLSPTMALLFAMMDKSDRGRKVSHQVTDLTARVATAAADDRLRRASDDIRALEADRSRLLVCRDADAVELERLRSVGRRFYWCEVTLTVDCFLEMQGLSLAQQARMAVLGLEDERQRVTRFQQPLLKPVGNHPRTRAMVYPTSGLVRWCDERGLALRASASPKACDA